MIENNDSVDAIKTRMEALRVGLARGIHRDISGTAIACALFYFDVVVIMNSRSLPNHRKIEGIVENYQVLMRAIFEFTEADPVLKASMAVFSVFGLMHCITQLVETTERIYELVGLDAKERFKQIRNREYWQFRNDHSHVIRNRRKKFGDIFDGFNTHFFHVEATSPNHIRYMTVGEPGYLIRSVDLSNMYNSLLCDLKLIFREVLLHCETFAPAK